MKRIFERLSLASLGFVIIMVASSQVTKDDNTSLFWNIGLIAGELLVFLPAYQVILRREDVRALFVVFALHGISAGLVMYEALRHTDGVTAPETFSLCIGLVIALLALVLAEWRNG